MKEIKKKLTGIDKELYQRIDEVIHYLWDPIGVSETPEARDEYYGYLPQIFNLTKKGELNELAEFLDKTQKETIGLFSNKEKNIEIAEILINWKETIKENNKIN